ncbi:MAG: alpha-galactosidase [Capsulimonadaceae bacterium]|nr:alpha-galactosidase [Capsulimonadaceae bacterium]
MTVVTAGENRVQLIGDTAPFVATLSAACEQDGVELVTLSLVASAPAKPGKLTLKFFVPCVDMTGLWSPSAERNRSLPPDWSPGKASSATSSAPVVTAFGGDGLSRLTLALSDAMNPVKLRAHVVEETGLLECGAILFEQVARAFDRYEVTLRIDRRVTPFASALDDVRAWWEAMPEYKPAPVPAPARLAMYSSWYSFHQHVDPAGIEKQCRLAKELGCEAVIVDDGWQTDNNERGYAYCGDWRVCETKIPDMRAHVARVHEIGLKYILWYSVPFVGVHSDAWARFQEKVLRPHHHPGVLGVLDPRYPDVREYLIGVYEKAVRDWDLDGFKLDFVDTFRIDAQPPLHPGEADFAGVPEAADRLLSDVIARLSALKPDICIEFRQSYIGPLMRKYGNMFRSGDCPDDAVQNRVHIVDIRLLAGSTATHADMLMWHPAEPVESAALQILNILFSVPQISVMLDNLPADHARMVRFWLGFWLKYRAVLLDAPIEPTSPELLYPVVSAQAGATRISVNYGAGIVKAGRKAVDEWIVVNAARTNGVILDGGFDANSTATIYNVFGDPVSSGGTRLGDGEIAKLDIPPAGYAVVSNGRPKA